MTKFELVEASRTRGLPAYKVTREKLIKQLDDWIYFSVIEKLPLSVLLWTSALYINRELTNMTSKLSDAVESIPEELINEVEYSKKGSSNKDIALKVIKAEQKSLETENSSDIEEDNTKKKDTNISLENKTLKNSEIEIFEEALENISSDFNSDTSQAKLDELKEDIETSDSTEELKQDKSPSKSKKIEQKLSKKLSKMISDLNVLSSEIKNESRNVSSENNSKTILDNTDSLKIEVSKDVISKALEDLKNLESSEDFNVDKIFSILDSNHDGKLGLKEVLEILEEINGEVKDNLSVEQMTVVSDMMNKIRENEGL
ncbi:MAG: letm1 and EF-hand domain-containing protein 1, mitochondrial [Paramarteilia canceri]